MLLQLLEYLLIGAGAGILAGFLGIGGSVIVVPSLLWVFSSHLAVPNPQIMKFVLGTSLAATVGTTIFSLRVQCKHGNMSWSLFKGFLPGITVGTVCGVLLAVLLDTHVLKTLFGVFVILVAAQLFFRLRESKTPGIPTRIKRSIAGVFIGSFAGLLGIGGGMLTIPYLTYYQVDIRKAMAVSTACSIIIALTGTISFMLAGIHLSYPDWSTGFVYWPAALVIACASPWFTVVGAHWSRGLSSKVLRNIFAIFLFVVGLNMLF